MTLKYSQARPLPTVNTNLYMSPVDKQAVISTISACNVSSSTDYIRVFVTPSGNGYDKNALYYDLELVGNDTFMATAGVIVPSGSRLMCYSLNGMVAFSAFYDELAIS